MKAYLFFIAAAFAASRAVAQPQGCPLEGDAKQALAKELNPFKNRTDAPPAAKINPAATLGAVLAPGPDLQRWSRDDAAVFEGVVINVKVGGIESVNCHAKDPAHRDTHIELALSPTATSTQRVIVEVTPHWREQMAAIADWSTSALKQQLLPNGQPGTRVRITGWLFDDLEHVKQAENTNPGGLSNWRATVWNGNPGAAGRGARSACTCPSPHAQGETSPAQNQTEMHTRSPVRAAQVQLAMCLLVHGTLNNRDIWILYSSNIPGGGLAL